MVFTSWTAKRLGKTWVVIQQKKLCKRTGRPRFCFNYSENVIIFPLERPFLTSNAPKHREKTAICETKPVLEWHRFWRQSEFQSFYNFLPVFYCQDSGSRLFLAPIFLVSYGIAENQLYCTWLVTEDCWVVGTAGGADMIFMGGNFSRHLGPSISCSILLHLLKQAK